MEARQKRRRKNSSFLAVGLALCLLAFAGLSSAQVSEYQEAPQLQALVEAGQLPPVEERLPANPLAVPVVERIGTYGGTWNTNLLGVLDSAWIARTMSPEALVMWSPDWSQILPNVAESWEASEDATEFTFYLREGIRFSDGHPFTADSIMFWYEDVIRNEELTPVAPAWLVINDQLVEVEKVDDYTVTFRFAGPHGLFLQNLANPWGAILMLLPWHHLQQYHIKYNPEGIEALVREHGASDWVELFRMMGGGLGADTETLWQNRLPTLNAWMITTPLGDGTRVVAERNPYYWKVDPEGNQLPYIDRVIYHITSDVEVQVLQVMAGDIDMTMRNVNTLRNKAVFTDNMERGNYRFFNEAPDLMNTMAIAFNLNHKDEVKREIFQNRDFRVGLSHAINRQEIIDLVYIGQGEPFQVAPRPESHFYDEEMAKQYTEYDVALANEHLDRAGYTERDAEGFRLGPDGQRISFIFEISSGRDPGWIDALELIQGYWRDVGIDMQFRDIDRSLLLTRWEAYEHDVSMWQGFGGLNVMFDTRWYFPSNPVHSAWAMAWSQWYAGTPGGEEPPEAPRRQMELYGQLRTMANPERQDELMREILQIAKEEFYTIGISLPAQGYGIVRNNFHNVPETVVSMTTRSPGQTNPSQYFIEDIAR